MTSSYIAALRHDHVIAPGVFDGAINGEPSLAWVNQILVPLLCPGDIVIMDSLSSHKVSGVREAIEAVGARLLYLPAYSPDLNPIEMLFAKLKSQVRSLATKTVSALWDALGAVSKARPGTGAGDRRRVQVSYRQPCSVVVPAPAPANLAKPSARSRRITCFQCKRLTATNSSRIQSRTFRLLAA
jgi:transposase